MNSHFKNYTEERTDKKVIENDQGFAVYQFAPEYVYIEDIYVTKEARKDGIASWYADQIASEAKSKGIHMMIGSVDPTAKGAETSVKVLLAYGFKLHASDQKLVWFKKEL